MWTSLFDSVFLYFGYTFWQCLQKRWQKKKLLQPYICIVQTTGNPNRNNWGKKSVSFLKNSCKILIAESYQLGLGHMTILERGQGQATPQPHGLRMGKNISPKGILTDLFLNAFNILFNIKKKIDWVMTPILETMKRTIANIWRCITLYIFLKTKFLYSGFSVGHILS